MRGKGVLAQAGFGRADLRHVKIANLPSMVFLAFADLIFNAPTSPDASYFFFTFDPARTLCNSDSRLLHEHL